jgi:sialic acid synthase SpsE
MALRTTFNTGLGELEIGEGLPPHLIAEIGLNHNGSLELAEQMIFQASLSGASIVKFQKRSPKDLAVAAFLDAPFEKCPAMGKTQRIVRERLELSLDEYRRLRAYAESLGLIFCASAFDLPSFEFLQQAGVPIIKLASHSVTNGPLLQKVADSKLPVICSFGGTTEEERDRAFALLKNNPLVILHCVSSYPTQDQLVKLDTIGYLRERYQVPVGFSSHEEGIDISVAATLLGACMVERHFTLDRAMVGLDQPISLTPNEFSEMAQKIRRLQKVRGVNAGVMPEEQAAKYAYHVAVCSVEEIPAGTRISEAMLTCKQPLGDPEKYFTGFELDQVAGRTAKQAIAADTPIPRDAIE